MRGFLKDVVVGNRSESLSRKSLNLKDDPLPRGRNATQLRPSPSASPSPRAHSSPTAGLQVPAPPSPSLRLYLAGPQRSAAGFGKSLLPAPPAGGRLPGPSSQTAPAGGAGADRAEQSGRRARRGVDWMLGGAPGWGGATAETEGRLPQHGLPRGSLQ